MLMLWRGAKQAPGACDGLSILRASGRQRFGLKVCLLLSMVLLLPSGQPLQSQQAPTISVNVRVVNVLATVRDKQGQIVRNLTKDDFTVEEDDRPQTISYFARETDLPLTLGLLVDTSLSQRRVLDQERTASYTFLDQVLRVNKDLAFVIHFDREVELLQDLTSSRQKLQTALGLLETPKPAEERGSNSPGSYPGSGGRGGGGRGGGSRGGAGTLLYDAVYLASNELMKNQQGRKALIILSDGVDVGSKETLASAVEAAQRADTLVYSILFADEEGYGGGGGFGRPGMGGRGGMGRGGGWPQRYPQQMRPDGKKILERISKETGGRLFEVSKKQAIDQIYDQIQEELRNQYSLGYTPDRASAGYHKIRLRTKQKDLIVQARDGYYGER
jgi:VWFA-related protein